MTQGNDRGRLIVFEGPDGVGKTTLAKALVDELTRRGLRCEYFSFPGRGPGTLGRLVYEVHHNPGKFGIDRIEPASLQVLHVAAHLDAIGRRILPTLEAGRSVVLDRFWWSTVVYGIVGDVNSSSLDAMIELELTSWSDVKPTIAFLVSRQSPLREEGSSDRWQKLRATYEDLAREQADLHPVETVPNEGSLDEALERILRTIEEDPTSDLDAPGNHGGIHQLGLGLSELTNHNTGHTRNRAPTLFSSLSPAKPTEVYDTFWHFAAERQAVFFERLKDHPYPWTEDPILRRYKFTNTYRASDRVSQYLIRNVIYEGNQDPREVFFRTILFKIFNRIETWEMLKREFGTVAYADYSFEEYDTVLTHALESGRPLFSAAYIMPSGGRKVGRARKHSHYLKLLGWMMEDAVPECLSEARNMREAFELLRRYPMIGDFLAYQYVTDVNYSEITNFSEMEFVAPGPGARNGIRKCFADLGGLSEVDIIKVVAERQREEFERLGLEFESLWGRPLQLIDCQNLFCEVDKYARVAHPYAKGVTQRTRIKQTYNPNPKPISYWYPPKWGINHLIPGLETGA